jgi:amino acid transporter
MIAEHANVYRLSAALLACSITSVLAIGIPLILVFSSQGTALGLLAAILTTTSAAMVLLCGPRRRKEGRDSRGQMGLSIAINVTALLVQAFAFCLLISTYDKNLRAAKCDNIDAAECDAAIKRLRQKITGVLLAAILLGAINFALCLLTVRAQYVSRLYDETSRHQHAATAGGAVIAVPVQAVTQPSAYPSQATSAVAAPRVDPDEFQLAV